MNDKTIRELQSSLPWTIRYSRDYRANPQPPHKDFTHALIHAGKALGKLLALADDMDHDREVADDPTLRERHAKYLADLVVCALRASNTFPGGVVDLQAATEARITTKNAPAPTQGGVLGIGSAEGGGVTGYGEGPGTGLGVAGLGANAALCPYGCGAPARPGGMFSGCSAGCDL